MKQALVQLFRALLQKEGEDGDHIPSWSKIVIVVTVLSLATLVAVDPPTADVIVNIFKS